ncbi:MAG TPA: GAF domain-containing sensor histidine kinase [Anaerolineales bacterium]
MALEYTCGMASPASTSEPLREELMRLRDMVIQRSKLLEISVTLNSTLELDTLLQFIINSAADLMDSEGASILLVDENTKDLYFAAATGADPEELRSIPVPLHGSIAGTIFREDKYQIINEVASDPRHFHQVDERTRLKTRSLVGVPMRIGEEVIGVLEAVNKRHGAFDEIGLRTLEIIGSQAAVAINNARLLRALKKAYEELGKLDRLKSDFIAIASHELRTPLGLILGYAFLLKEEAKDQTSELAEAVMNSAQRMSRLIEEMTNLNMMQVSSPELNLTLQPLQGIAKAAQAELAELIQAKGQTLMVELPDIPLQAQVDEAKLKLALTNLLNNAMRFTPAAGQLQLRLERHGTEAWLRVIDNGIGIPETELERIFGRFYQVENHMVRRHEGMGLGLSIVRAIAGAHGGRVWAESSGTDQGSTFTIALNAA